MTWGCVRGQDPEEVDKSGMTALMIACQVGRAHNVDLLLSKAAKGIIGT